MLEKLKSLYGLNITANELLKNHTTFKIGGPADYFVVVEDKKSLFQALKAAQELCLPYHILGGGSNILISDDGLRGLVIKLSGGVTQFNGPEITVFAGANLGQLVREALTKSLGGLEFAGNIPGTVGGAIRGNAGAYGLAIGDFIKSIDVINLKTMTLETLSKAACGFEYRNSKLKQNPHLIVAEALLILTAVTEPEKLRQQVDDEMATRCAKQPLEYPSAGCTFKNFVYNEDLARYKDWEIKGKIPAAKFIDDLDLKGTKIGGAQISTAHANFIINLGDATAQDVMQLISLVKSKVRAEYNVQLEEEIQYIGFE